MTYELAIGDRTYSSWSLRGWLPFDKWDLPVTLRRARLYTEELPRLLADFAPARLVPAMKHAGAVVHDTLAIAETLAERHPDRQMWPADATRRAEARSLVAEMHSGFGALRGACPMNLAHAWEGFAASDAVLADCARMDMLWCRALDRSGGPWLFGQYSLADVFFAPAATRFATYGLPRSAQADAYVERHLADPSLRRWRAMGRAENHHQPTYDMPLKQAPWPGPTPLPAHAVEAVEAGPSVNDTCPYSGRPVTDFLALDGRVYGFCNRFCRDKTLADPAVFPRFMELLPEG